MMELVPQFVPVFTASFYIPAIYTALIVGFIGLIGLVMAKKDLQLLIITDIVGLAMLIIVAAVGTDLAEALILPGLVVELAEIMAISEILMAKEMRKIIKKREETPDYESVTGIVTEKPSIYPTPFLFDMEILHTAPNFLALVFLAYGIFLSGFTGGAVAGAGILFYVLSRKARGLPVFVLDGVGAVSGLAWCLWIIGFLLFFLNPSMWLLGLFMAAFGLLLKVASKMGLIALMMREEIKRD